MYDPVEAARSLQPSIREAAERIEDLRRLPPDLVEAMRSAGLFHMLIPQSIGGQEADPVAAARAVEEVAYADGSAGWCVMLAAQSTGFAGLMPEAEAREVFGHGGIIAGTARPIGRAVAVQRPEAGYIVSGRWPFASGSSHADWFMGECVVYDGDQVRLDAQGNQVTRAVFVPRSEVTTYDTWHTTGLRGTASNDFSVTEVFVPEGRGFQMLVVEPQHPWVLYAYPQLVFMNHGSHALGLARAALDAATEAVRTKRGWGDQPLREVLRVQSVVAEATALIESARCYLYATAEELWAAAQSDAAETQVLRSRVRLAASHAARSSVQAIDLLHSTLGTTAIFVSNPLERIFRDIHTAAAHVMIGQLTYQAAGRVELGMEPDFPFF
ncbi:MAG: acyl-CoA dehydrogenase family protein [Dehalococcoidia bacterium]|nr:acyl-CoA dehydrogenase family protein [Dehalococcoidia bacterium]